MRVPGLSSKLSGLAPFTSTAYGVIKSWHLTGSNGRHP